MTHFSVLAISDKRPDEAAMQEILLPWHEYECTGIKRYLQWVDHTDEVTKEFHEMCNAAQGPDGKFFHGYEDIFYRDPTPEEQSKIGAMAGIGFGHGMMWSSRDWGDGRGYRTKISFMPDGFIEVQVPQSTFYKSVSAFAKDYHGYTIRKNGSIGRMTNPNAKWDWWQIGGRYSGKLLVKEGAMAFAGKRSWMNREEAIVGLDQAKRDDIDLDAMKRMQVDERREWAEECCVKAGRPIADLDIACRIAPIAHAEWMALDHPKPRGGAYYDWIEKHGGEWPILAAFGRACFDLPDVPANMSLQEWIDAAPPITSWAVVMDNQWFEKGKMGWWAMSSDDKANWDDHFNDLFGLIAPNQWVTVVDCHI